MDRNDGTDIFPNAIEWHLHQNSFEINPNFRSTVYRFYDEVSCFE